jgi:hypothetical protein
MNDSQNTFERLVLTLGSSERQAMLRLLAESGEQKALDKNASGEVHDTSSTRALLAEKKLAEEPLLLRIWLSIVSFFTSSSPTRVYANYKVNELGRILSHSYNVYIDVAHRSYREGLYTELLRLRDSQVFFSSLLSSYENDKGGFYIVLGSLLIKDTHDAIVVASDPFSLPYDQELKRDPRVSLVHDMDVAFNTMPEMDRGKMYMAAGAIEWMKTYCALPIDKMITRFGMIPGAAPTCMVDSVSEDMKLLVNTLSSAKKIPVLLLEALYLFSVQSSLAEEKFDLEKACHSFVDSATEYLAAIRLVKESVPFADFVRFAIGDVAWQPQKTAEGEDWFVLYRNAWRKRFDERWVEWNRLHRAYALERSMHAFLGTGEIPAMQYRPWDDMWLDLDLRRELSFRFLKGMFLSVYPALWMKPLKILLLEGDFFRRENLAEYTDAFSMLDHMQQTCEVFETRLSPKGDVGEGFALVKNERMATISGKARLDNLMLSINSEAEQLVSSAITALRSVDAVLGGVLGSVRGGPYETILNLSSIQGKLNERFRKDLEGVRRMVGEALQILTEAELIEKEKL